VLVIEPLPATDRPANRATEPGAGRRGGGGAGPPRAALTPRWRSDVARIRTPAPAAWSAWPRWTRPGARRSGAGDGGCRRCRNSRGAAACGAAALLQGQGRAGGHAIALRSPVDGVLRRHQEARWPSPPASRCWWAICARCG
jgi:hypothetical protein